MYCNWVLVYKLNLNGYNFRNIKKKGYRKIYVTKIPDEGIGIAINDRLKRASK